MTSLKRILDLPRKRKESLLPNIHEASHLHAQSLEMDLQDEGKKCKKTQAQNMPLAYFAFVGFEFVLKYKVSDVLLLGRDIRMKTDYCIELYTTLPPTLQEMNAYWIYVLQIRFHYSLIALRRYTMASQNSLWGFHLCTINSLLHAHFQRKRSTYVHNLI